MRFSRVRRLLLVCVLPAAIRCGGDPTGPQVPAALVLVSGDGQTGPVGQALPSPVVVKVVDAGGASVPGVTIVWSVTNGGGTLSTTTTTTDAVGAAAVTWTMGSSSGDNAAKASVDAVPTIAAAVFSATAVHGAAAKLLYTVQPSAVAAGGAIAPSIQVTVQDAFGNTATSATTSVTLSITSATGTAGAVLGGTPTQLAVAGVATFANVMIDKVGTAYSLRATATGLESATSSSFSVGPGVATKLAFAVQPTASASGAAMSPAVQVTVQDAFGNSVTSATTGVTLAITSGTGTNGAVLGGTLTQAAVAGVASFANVTVDKVGTLYTLTAAATNLTGAISSTFAVSPGAPAALVFAAQPADTTAGARLSPAILVKVLDAQANVVTSATAGITLAITGGTGTGGAVLGGTLTRAAVAGVASFADLTVDRGGAGYTLTATATGLRSATSLPLSIFDLWGTSPAAGVNHTCGLTTVGAAFCWGLNDQGQLGDVTTTSQSHPTPVSGGFVFRDISVGDAQSCGLTTAGAYCWGSNGNGQLGDGSSISFRSRPVAVTGGLDFQSLTAGGSHTCALTAGGAAYCWGNNDYGQLGDGTSGAGDRRSPVLVSGGLLFTAISAGATHTCALTASGAAYCWGESDHKFVTSNSATFSVHPTPEPVSGGLVFQSITAGTFYTCGLVAGGATYCWGWNYWGQLGDGTTTDRPAPVAVSGGLSFHKIDAGGSHTCGVISGWGTGGPAYCWGFKGLGELGDGDVVPQGANATSPVAVSGNLSFQAISSGNQHTCGLTTGGSAYCWGDDQHGQLGDGKHTSWMSLVPLAVLWH